MSQPKSSLSRRTLFVGAGVAGAAAAAATLLPQAIPPQDQAANEAQPKPERGGGYQLSEHVKRYYKSTLV